MSVAERALPRLPVDWGALVAAWDPAGGDGPRSWSSCACRVACDALQMVGAIILAPVLAGVACLLIALKLDGLATDVAWSSIGLVLLLTGLLPVVAILGAMCARCAQPAPLLRLRIAYGGGASTGPKFPRMGLDAPSRSEPAHPSPANDAGDEDDGLSGRLAPQATTSRQPLRPALRHARSSLPASATGSSTERLSAHSGDIGSGAGGAGKGDGAPSGSARSADASPASTTGRPPRDSTAAAARRAVPVLAAAPGELRPATPPVSARRAEAAAAGATAVRPRRQAASSASSSSSARLRTPLHLFLAAQPTPSRLDLIAVRNHPVGLDRAPPFHQRPPRGPEDERRSIAASAFISARQRFLLGLRRRGAASDPPLAPGTACMCGPRPRPLPQQPQLGPTPTHGGGVPVLPSSRAASVGGFPACPAAGPVRALAEGGSANDLCSCGACLAATVFADVACVPQWLAVTVSSLAVLAAPLPPIVIGAALLADASQPPGAALGSAASSRVVLEALPWGAAAVPLVVSAASCVCWWPCMLACDCEWQRVRRLLPLCLGSLCLVPMLSVVLVAAGAATVSLDSGAPHINLGAALTPLLLASAALLVAVATLCVLARRETPFQPTLDPSAVVPACNPALQRLLRERPAATPDAAAPAAGTGTGTGTGETRARPALASVGSGSGSGSGHAAGNRPSMGYIGSESRALEPAAIAPSIAEEAAAGTAEAGGSAAPAHSESVVELLSSAEGAGAALLASAHRRRPAWLRSAPLCACRWHQWLFGAGIGQAMLLLACAVTLGVANDGSAGALPAGVALFLLFIFIAANNAALVAVSLRQREAMGGFWTGFYSGADRRTHTNAAHSLRLRPETSCCCCRCW